MMHPIIASVSGGKDSTALCLWLKEQGLEYRAVHMDTGWEHPETDRYLREVLPEFIGPIEWIIPPRGMVELVKWKGMFPGRRHRFCTSHLKMLPFMEWMETNCPDGAINAIGIRAAESQARSKLWFCEMGEWGWIWRPLLRWSEADVIAIHQRHDLAPNPLYLPPYNCSRVGCWPCIYARKSEIATLARTDPDRIDLIRSLEAELGARSIAEPTFFAQRLEDPIKRSPTPIDKAVEWSRTARGGKQQELFHDPDRSGCLRWGLCDG